MLSLTRAGLEKRINDVAKDFSEDKRLHGSIILLGAAELVGGVMMKRPAMKKAGVVSIMGGAGGLLLMKNHPTASAVSSLAGAALSSYFIFR